MKTLYEQTAYKTSRSVTNAYSTSFSLAVRILKTEKRNAIYSIYGFVRLADEIVDTFLDFEQEDLLNEFVNEFKTSFQRKISMNPIIHSFVTTVYKYNISIDLIEAFLNSMRMDLYKSQYHSAYETSEYIYGSAEVVGLMCLKVFTDGNETLYRELKKPASSLGSAFQKVNFLRDLKADYEQLNRTYFSGFERDTFSESHKNQLINEIENEFNEALNGIKKLPGRSKVAVYLAYLYYMQLLNKLLKTPARQIISQRVRVNNFIKLILFIKASLLYKLKLI